MCYKNSRHVAIIKAIIANISHYEHKVRKGKRYLDKFQGNQTQICKYLLLETLHGKVFNPPSKDVWHVWSIFKQENIAEPWCSKITEVENRLVVATN